MRLFSAEHAGVVLPADEFPVTDIFHLHKTVSHHLTEWKVCKSKYGWKNYASVFSRKDCFSALKLSLYYMGGSVVQLVLAL